MKTRFTLLMVLIFLMSIATEGFGNQLRKSRFSERPESKSTEKEMQLKKLQNSKFGAARINQLFPGKTLTNNEMWELESVVATDDWKTVYHYNENGQNTEVIEMWWDEEQEDWVAVWREVWSWSNDQIVLIEEYWWDDDAGQWLHEWKTEFSYDGNTVTLLFYHLIDGNNWVLTYKEVIELDENENIALFTAYFWDEFAEDWMPMWLEEYTYDAQNRLVLFMEYYYYDFAREWMHEWKEETTYTGNTAETLGYYWDWDGEWVLEEKIEFLLDAYGDILEEVFLYWDEDDEVWVIVDKAIFTYNYDYGIESLVVPVFYEFKHMVTHAAFYYWSDEMWIEIFSVELNWKDISTGLVSVSDPFVRLYPNPATDYFHIIVNRPNSSYTFELFDMGGRLLNSTQFKGDAKLSTDGLEAGMYFYQIRLSDERVNGKIMVK